MANTTDFDIIGTVSEIFKGLKIKPARHPEACYKDSDTKLLFLSLSSGSMDGQIDFVCTKAVATKYDETADKADKTLFLKSCRVNRDIVEITDKATGDIIKKQRLSIVKGSTLVPVGEEIAL